MCVWCLRPPCPHQFFPTLVARLERRMAALIASLGLLILGARGHMHTHTFTQAKGIIYTLPIKLQINSWVRVYNNVRHRLSFNSGGFIITNLKHLNVNMINFFTECSWHYFGTWPSSDNESLKLY